MNDIIKVENLVKKFGELVAVDNISFTVAMGEIFGFLGPNGAGKTTTINILCTLAKPTSGQASIDGFDVVHQQKQVRQLIGLVFQDPSLDERLSGLQNLRFHAMVYNVPASVSEQRIKQVLTMTEALGQAQQRGTYLFWRHETSPGNGTGATAPP
jgi:ABC-2 type transport system ATP-binding protein